MSGSSAEQAIAAGAVIVAELSPLPPFFPWSWSAFFSSVGASIVLKLSMSIDDLVWFSPLLAQSRTVHEKWVCCMIYSVTCVAITAAAIFGLGFAAEAAFDAALGDKCSPKRGGRDGDCFWDASRVLGAVAGGFVLAFALWEYVAWRKEGHTLHIVCCGTDGRNDDEWGDDGLEEDEEDGQMRETLLGPSNCVGTDSPSPSELSGKKETKMDMEDERDRPEVHRLLSIADYKNSRRRESSADPDPASRVDEGDGDGGDYCEVRAGNADGNGDCEENAGDVDGVDRNDDASEEGNSHAASAASTVAMTPTACRVLAVTLSGSMDNLIIFAVATSGDHRIHRAGVLPGVVLGCCVVCVTCWQITRCGSFAKVARKIPPWLLLLLVSFWLLIRVFLF